MFNREYTAIRRTKGDCRPSSRWFMDPAILWERPSRMFVATAFRRFLPFWYVPAKILLAIRIIHSPWGTQEMSVMTTEEGEDVLLPPFVFRESAESQRGESDCFFGAKKPSTSAACSGATTRPASPRTSPSASAPYRRQVTPSSERMDALFSAMKCEARKSKSPSHISHKLISKQPEMSRALANDDLIKLMNANPAYLHSNETELVTRRQRWMAI